MNGDFPPFPFGVGEYDPEVYPYHCFGDHDAFANPNPFLGDPGIHLNHQQISSDSTIYLAKNDYCPDSTYYSTVGTSTASSPSLSEPLVPTSNALNEEDEDEFDTQDNRKQRTFCNVRGCGASFARKTDINRHKKQKHENDSVIHICGCCMESGKWTESKRKDKLMEHKQKIHGCAKKSQLLPCPQQHASGKQTVWFCSETALNAHLSVEHGYNAVGKQCGTINSGQVGHVNAPPPAGYVTQSLSNSSSANQLHNAVPPSPKRPNSSKTDATIAMKRPRLVGCHGEGSTMEAHLLEALLQFDGAVNICSKDNTEAEVAIANVQPAEFLRLSKSGVLPGKYLDIRFDISKSSVTLIGSAPRVRALKAVLDLVLNASTSTLKFIENMLPPSMRPSLPISSCEPSRTTSTEEFTGHHILRIFPMKQTDAPLVQKWHNDVVPFLMNCLDTYLGSCYTASLVRQGASERDSKVVVRIQCQRMPAPNARSSIQTQICKKFDTNPAGETIRVKFLKRELVYLSGGTGFDDMEEEEEEEEELFPYYKLYWKHPGMGASVGMLPDCESRTATLGCWIHIEKELYLLTVKHLIGKQVLKDFVDGKSPCLQVTSPSHGVLEKLEGDLAHFRRQITEDMGEEIRKIAPEGGLLKQEDAQNSKTLDTLLSQNDKIKEHLDECYLDPQAYLIGTVKFWSDPEAVRQPLSSQNPKFGHAMDWAACKAGHRFGANKHRYRYVGEEYEGVYWDIDNKWGAGNIVHGVAPISENDKVYFVGSTSGRVDATVHSAGIAVDSKGIKSLEWALIPSSKQQKEAAKYRGDSGAAVIRNSDNALVAHLWGAVDEPALLLITPMEDVFADIKAKSGTDKVSLATYPPEPRPVSPVPVTEYTQLCSRKSNTQLRSQRRKVNLSSIPLRPKNAPPTPNTLPVSPSTTGPLMITSNAIQGPPRPLLNLFDTLTTILPSPAKNPSFVSSIPAGDMSRTASPLTRILFKFPSSVKQNITLHRIMSSARPKHPYASARSVRTYQKTHNITKRPKVINAY